MFSNYVTIFFYRLNNLFLEFYASKKYKIASQLIKDF